MAFGIPNPVAFSPMAVTFIITIVYLGLAIPLIVLHETVPKAPSNPVLYTGVNTTEAWLDLTTLTKGYHPYNSRSNDEVRNWLLTRIANILDSNNVLWDTETRAIATPQSTAFSAKSENAKHQTAYPQESRRSRGSPAVTVFNDLQSNVSFSARGSLASPREARKPGSSVYFEGTNIMVYIRGIEDEEDEWWNSAQVDADMIRGKGGVLVNAHYDSVSTGYGATDDGVGVITILQLIRFFTTPGNQPKKGLVALLNNGEEDFLNGARAYTQHPISTFPYTFLNLEGAGAGGRAVLFRSTDAEVTKSYAKSPHPFGTVVGADGFKTGLIRSGTDYSVFTETLGLRGLDVAFWYPRARYHTDQDDAKHTSVDSVWHMLSASMSTVHSLTSDTGSTFLGPRGDGAKGKVKNGKGSDAVWFDLFGIGFVVFELHGLFAWSLTLLIVAPLILLFLTFLLVRQGKFYYFAGSTPCLDGGIEGEPLILNGWRGFSRFPIALIISSGLTFGSALLIAKVNPLIIYSSHYTVWSMMLCLYFTVFWFIMRGADFMRASALHRGYAFLWMFTFGWILLVGATVLEDRFKIATGYIIVIFESAVFLATVISLCELFALPTKDEFAHSAHMDHETRGDIGVPPDSDALIAPTPAEHVEDWPAEPTEATPLFGDNSHASHPITTFANYARRSAGGKVDDINASLDKEHEPYGDEQAWSGKLPTWTWLIQFILVTPTMIVIVGQVGLFVVGASAQTGPDGGSLLIPYLLMATFTIFLLLPVAPFTHRLTFHVPTFLFLVFIGTCIYSLVAFPFSATSRYKTYFIQYVDLETGENSVNLAGLEEYIRPIISTLPSAAGQKIKCRNRDNLRAGVQFCSWIGIAPRAVESVPVGVPPEKGFADWLDYTATRVAGRNAARFTIRGSNTRACVLKFARPIKEFNVLGSGRDNRFDHVPEGGSEIIKLWHRNWDETWTVDVEWEVGDGKTPGEEGIEGRVVCLWSDGNAEGLIPALDEIRRYAPDWVAVTKASDGLVEGSKAFIV